MLPNKPNKSAIDLLAEEDVKQYDQRLQAGMAQCDKHAKGAKASAQKARDWATQFKAQLQLNELKRQTAQQAPLTTPSLTVK